jgi:hypothetical protein
MPRIPAVLPARSIFRFLARSNQMRGQAFVDEHGRVAQDEFIVAEGGQLHRVLDETGAGGEAGAGHAAMRGYLYRQPCRMRLKSRPCSVAIM